MVSGKKGRQKDTEGQILEAAKKIFVRKGYAGARMQEIADEASINKAMLHYYFRSKEQLFQKIIESAVNTVMPELVKALSGTGNVLQKSEKLVDNYIDAILDNPHIPLFILYELSQNNEHFIQLVTAKIHRQQTFQKFTAQILEEQKTGGIKSVPPHHLILTIMSLIVFPFIAKPIFKNIFEISEEDYLNMMIERKPIVKNFIRSMVSK